MSMLKAMDAYRAGASDAAPVPGGSPMTAVMDAAQADPSLLQKLMIKLGLTPAPPPVQAGMPPVPTPPQTPPQSGAMNMNERKLLDQLGQGQ